MGFKNDPDGPKGAKKLKSGYSLQLFLIVFFTVSGLSFIIAGWVRYQPEPSASLPAVSAPLKPIIKLPPDFDLNPNSATASQGTEDTQTDEAALEAPPPESPEPVEARALVTTTTTTQPVVLPEEKAAAKDFNIPPPKWKAVDGNWSESELSSSSFIDNPYNPKTKWEQIGVSAPTTTLIKPPKVIKGELNAVKRLDIKNGHAVATTSPIYEASAPQPGAAPTTGGEFSLAGLDAPPTTAKSQPAKPKAAAPKPSAAPPRAQSQPASGLTVAIINASGDKELAKVYREVLAAMGFKPAAPQEKPRQEGQSVLYYNPAYKNQAQELAARLPSQLTLKPLDWKSAFPLVLILR